MSRWGKQDELGTLNLITPEKRASAFRFAREGTAVTCARAVTTDITAYTTFQVMRFMVDSGAGRDPNGYGFCTTVSCQKRRTRDTVAVLLECVLFAEDSACRK